jgi:hypothetical protein
MSPHRNHPESPGSGDAAREAAPDTVTMDARALAVLPLRVASDVATRATLAGLDAVLASRVATEAVDRIIASALVEHAVDQLLAGDGLERVLASADTAGVPQRVIDSHLIDEAVDRLLQSEDLWLLVDEIARSPAVTEAIGTQSIGFADQVAGVVRNRSRTADARLENIARRVLRRQAAAVEPQRG